MDEDETPPARRRGCSVTRPSSGRSGRCPDPKQNGTRQKVRADKEAGRHYETRLPGRRQNGVQGECPAEPVTITQGLTRFRSRLNRGVGQRMPTKQPEISAAPASARSGRLAPPISRPSRPNAIIAKPPATAGTRTLRLP